MKIFNNKRKKERENVKQNNEIDSNDGWLIPKAEKKC